jgi:hypothetical protein
MFASGVVDRGLTPRSGPKTIKLVFCASRLCSEALKSKSKDCLVWNQDNVKQQAHLWTVLAS